MSSLTMTSCHCFFLQHKCTNFISFSKIRDDFHGFLTMSQGYLNINFWYYIYLQYSIIAVYFFFHQSPIFHDTGQNKFYFQTQLRVCLQFQYTCTSFTIQHLFITAMKSQIFFLTISKFSLIEIENLIPLKKTLRSVNLQFQYYLKIIKI